MSVTVSFRHGPDAAPFFLDGQGMAVEEAGRVPFHGIISRGLLEHAGHSSSPGWPELGHRLDDEEVADCPELAALQEAARDCGVLRFAQSAQCARACVERLLADPASMQALGLPPAPARLTLWNVKEGHISSVWQARLECGSEVAEFAINVARDRLAGEELRQISGIMQRIAESWPEANLARVQDIAEVRLPELAHPVVVTRNDWVADALELHRLPAPEGGEGALIAVERFLTDESAPSQIVRIRGRRLAVDEITQIERDMAEFLHRTAEFAVRTEINHGDLVWNGRRAVVVAFQQQEVKPCRNIS